jgi:phosphoribosylaminoimidazole-succinocarboxamide synthase
MISAITEALKQPLEGVDLTAFGATITGKVRDMCVLNDRRILVTTDRVSAFDRVLGTIPYKGQVLNQLSGWWFEQLGDVVNNHMISMPDPNVMITHEAAPLPVEVIVRGYITGSTSTSLWTLYEAGVERPYGLDLPEGLVKNSKLPTPVITPTTKAEVGEHDERLTSAEVLERGLVEPELWAQVQRVALDIFAAGQAAAQKAGLILVDTKYEFGMINGQLSLIDEVHTPDSSRYWIADTYAEAMSSGNPPNQFDKEHLRLWLKARGYNGDGPAPTLTDEIRAEVAQRYIDAFEKLTQTQFVPGDLPPSDRVNQNLLTYLGGN